MWGYFKKLVIADRIVVAVNAIVGQPDIYSGFYVFCGMLFYAAELYADFTGGIDITIGIAQMFGIQLAENFERPYFSKNIAEYWRRWHITMGTWFKDYLFYPLSASMPVLSMSTFCRRHFGAAAGRRIPVYFVTLVVWFATGIWHGASWNFVLWGLIFFVLLTIERLGLGKLLAKTKVLKHIYVIFLIPLTWVVFALPNMQDIATYFSRLFPFFADNTASFVNTKDVIRALHDYWYLLIACVVFCLPFPSRWYEKHKNSKLVILGLVLIYLMSVYKMQTQTSNPFLYYQF